MQVLIQRQNNVFPSTIVFESSRSRHSDERRRNDGRNTDAGISSAGILEVLRHVRFVRRKRHPEYWFRKHRTTRN